MKKLPPAALLWLALLWLPLPAPAQEAPVSMGLGLERLLGDAQKNCAEQRADFTVAVAGNDLKALPAAAASRDYFCVCLPGGINALRARSSPAELAAPLPGAELAKAAGPVFEHCAAQSYRAQVRNGACAQDTSVAAKDRKRYCQCYAAKLDQMGDKEIAESTRAAYEKSRAKAAGRAAPDNANKPTRIEEAEAGCRAQ